VRRGGERKIAVFIPSHLILFISWKGLDKEEED
jgi:hypothetical protein